MKTLATLSLLILAITLTGCDETKKVIDVAGSVQLNGTYTVKSISGEKIMGAKPSLTFSALDNSVNGSTGCNSVFGNYTLDLYTIDFGDLATTKKACAEKDVQKTEQNFLNALNKTGSYNLQDRILTFYSKTDRSVLLTATKDTNGQN